MPLSIILNIFVAVLLVVMIGYAVVLNKRLGTLRRDKHELQKLALSFGDATMRAEDSTAQLRATIQVLQEHIGKAESLREDLVFLVERGNGTADTLESLVRTARDDLGAVPRPSVMEPAPQPAAKAADRKDAPVRSAPKPVRDEAAESMSDAERELLKALRSAG